MASLKSKINFKVLLGLALWLSMIGIIVAVVTLPISTDKPVDIKFLSLQENDQALVFFGFRGCSSICPTTLSVLRNLLLLEKDESKWPQLTFIDIERVSSQQHARDYAQQFHPHISGYHPTEDELAELVRQFGLRIALKNEQIDHLGRLYLLQKRKQTWFLVKTYSASNYSAETLKSELFM
ncbi:MAG: SCO family protein [Kangiellaceae bacterium]|nr:SCO family protein [Kangiellaceae bacterium]